MFPIKGECVVLAVQAEGLTRRYGDRTVVDGIDLAIPTGTVHALLGRNGSGKTTTMRMLSTLLRPSAGTARILGFDVIEQAREVQRRIGLVGQSHAVDPRLTGRQNLVMFARLNGCHAPSARTLAGDLLDRFDLADAADRPAGSYSGGMRRRLDILAGMIVRPAVLFLDEPTTGIDPFSRNEIFGYLRQFVREGTTVVLTTQYLDEAHRLAEGLTILDEGRVVATGTPQDIIDTAGVGLDIVVDHRHSTETRSLIAAFGGRVVGSEPLDDPLVRESFTFDAEAPPLLTTMRALDATGIEVHDIGRRTATLDEAFLALTGKEAAR